MFATVSEARFYIDNREGIYSPRWLVFASRSYEAMREVEAPDMPQEIRRDATMVPEHPAHDDVVEVIAESDRVCAKYKRMNHFAPSSKSCILIGMVNIARGCVYARNFPDAQRIVRPN